MGKKKASKPGDRAAKTATTLRRKAAKAARIARSLAKAATKRGGHVKARRVTENTKANRATASELRMARAMMEGEL